MQDIAVTSPGSEKASHRPMAVSSDVILTTRSHSTADLSVKNSSSAAAASSKSGGGAASFTHEAASSDSNVAACYGVDTVHSWATVSAAGGSGQRLSGGWRSAVDLSTGSTTVSLDASPVGGGSEKPKSRGVDEASATWSAGELQEQVPVEGGGALTNGHVDSLEAPRPPPRTKRKPRPALPTSLTTAADDKGLGHIILLSD